MKSRRKATSEVEILILRDSPTQAEQLRHLLQQRDYKVRVAADGREALAAVRRRKPALVISDIVMPEMDGFTFCRELKSRKRFKDIPVILLTTLTSSQDVIKALQCGANNFIRKPYDERYLLSRIEYFLANQELRKSEKIQMGLKVRFDSKEYLITSERQQMDLLISIYEEAVHLNADLVRSYESLDGLYHIAVDLNGSLSVQSVVEKALDRALDLPGVRAGWVALYEGEATFRLAAARGLPADLKVPLEGDCMCRKRFLAGELDRGVNILECERLRKAEGDTQGLRYHASVPLWTDGRRLGILNLVGGDEEMFSDEELKILHGVGNSVAVALERARLYESLENKVEERTAALSAEIAERKRAQEEARINLERIQALHEITVHISSTLDLRAVLDVLLEKAGIFLLRPFAATVQLLNRKTGEWDYLTCGNLDEEEWKRQRMETSGVWVEEVMETGAPLIVWNIQTDPRSRNPEFYRKQGLVSCLRVPLTTEGNVLGVFSVFTKEEHEFSKQEVEFLATLAGHAAIAINIARLYEQLKKQVLDLNRAIEAKDEFLSIVSHELRTPLNVVIGYAGMMMDGLLGEVNAQQKEALKKILGRADDQLFLINNILFASAIEAGEIRVASHEVDVLNLLDQLKDHYQAPLNKKLALEWESPPESPTIKTDGPKLRHILQNLIENAIKFTDRGQVTISAKMVGSQEARVLPNSGSWVEFKVSDTGIGIPEEMLSTVFDRFRQVDSSETRLHGGVGMGLYIVKKFAELIGGKVEVESEVGKGSTFTITIPC